MATTRLTCSVSKSLGSRPERVIVLHFGATATMPLSSQEYKWVSVNCQERMMKCRCENHRSTSKPPFGKIATLSFASNCGNWDKQRWRWLKACDRTLPKIIIYSVRSTIRMIKPVNLICAINVIIFEINEIVNIGLRFNSMLNVWLQHKSHCVLRWGYKIRSSKSILRNVSTVHIS